MSCIYVRRYFHDTDFGPLHPAYNSYFSACFFSRNNIFLSQKISQQYFSAGLSAQLNGAFLGSTRKKHASHAWRSMLVGKEVLGRGLIKRIGDSTSTNFWQDMWIQLHCDARPITARDDQEVSLVPELLTGSG
jgi:hypothetical protein